RSFREWGSVRPWFQGTVLDFVVHAEAGRVLGCERGEAGVGRGEGTGSGPAPRDQGRARDQGEPGASDRTDHFARRREERAGEEFGADGTGAGEHAVRWRSGGWWPRGW